MLLLLQSSSGTFPCCAFHWGYLTLPYAEQPSTFSWPFLPTALSANPRRKTSLHRLSWGSEGKRLGLFSCVCAWHCDYHDKCKRSFRILITMSIFEICVLSCIGRKFCGLLSPNYKSAFLRVCLVTWLFVFHWSEWAQDRRPSWPGGSGHLLNEHRVLF